MYLSFSKAEKMSEEKKWKQESLPHKERRMKKWPMSHVKEEEAWSARNGEIRRRRRSVKSKKGRITRSQGRRLNQRRVKKLHKKKNKSLVSLVFFCFDDRGVHRR
ncbi:unnamed protein product [Brassica oleracea var. botrytis]